MEETHILDDGQEAHASPFGSNGRPSLFATSPLWGQHGREQSSAQPGAPSSSSDPFYMMQQMEQRMEAMMGGLFGGPMRGGLQQQPAPGGVWQPPPPSQNSQKPPRKPIRIDEA